jgi:two-component system cell cycle sensor histidine kinase PleC
MNREVKYIDKNIVDVSKKRTASSRAVRDFRSRLSAVGTSPQAYELELLKGFSQSQVKAALILPLMVLAVTAISVPWLGLAIALPWAAIAATAHFANSILASKFLGAEVQNDQLDKWRLRFLMCQIAIAVVWSAFSAFPFTLQTSANLATLQFSAILALNAAISMMCYSLGRIILIVASPPTLILAGKFFLTQETSMMLMGGMLIASLAFFYFTTSRFKESLMEILEHGTEKETLIAELETEKAFSEEARKRAEEANMAKSRFLATMSHELRTPLNAILGFSEIMRDEVLGPIGNKTYLDYTKDIHNSGSHLLKLINEILDISRIEAGKHELEEKTLSLISIAEEARHMLEVKAKQKNIELTTSYEEDMSMIWVDERAIRQILLNLLSNALKFTPPGGKITIMIGWTSKGGQYISVNDTGPGISEEEIPIVLSSFGQGSIAIKDAEQGTGLGLSIVQALLHVHQGRFDLKSELRKGTRAIAYLPKERVMTRNKIQTQTSAPSKNSLVA